MVSLLGVTNRALYVAMIRSAQGEHRYGISYDCSGPLFHIGACLSEAGAAGVTPQQVRESFINAGLVLTSAAPVGEAIGIVGGVGRVLFRGSRVARVFWQGGDVAKNAATDFAVANGARTIGMTFGGKVLEITTARLPWSVARPLWRGASWVFARTSRGQVDVFINMARPNPESIWANTELPTLIANQNVRNIEFHLISPP